MLVYIIDVKNVDLWLYLAGDKKTQYPSDSDIVIMESNILNKYNTDKNDNIH